MMTRAEITAAIARLAQMDRQSAAERAYEYARALLRNETPAQTATHQTQEWALALALFFSAAATTEDEHRYATLQAVIEERFHRLCSPASDSEVFAPLIDLPPSLARYLSALSALPRQLVLKSIEELRDRLQAAP